MRDAMRPDVGAMKLLFIFTSAGNTQQGDRLGQQGLPRCLLATPWSFNEEQLGVKHRFDSANKRWFLVGGCLNVAQATLSLSLYCKKEKTQKCPLDYNVLLF